MKVYYAGTRKNIVLRVQPGVHFPENTAWHEVDGRPKLLEVHFVDGVAEVDDNLGNYLIDKKLANKSFLILPNEVA